MEAALKPQWYNPTPGEEETLQKHLRLVSFTIGKMGSLPIEYADAQSLGQEGLLRAIRTYNPEISKWTTWAVLNIRNTITKHIRDLHAAKRICPAPQISIDARLQMQDGDDMKFDLPDTRLNVEEDSVRHMFIEQLLGRMSKRERAIAEMIMQGYGQQEVADQLGISQAHVSRSLKKMRRYAEEEPEVALTAEIRAQVEEMLRDPVHKSLADIQKATGVSHPTIIRIKKEIGLMSEEPTSAPVNGAATETAAQPAGVSAPLAKPVRVAPSSLFWNAHICAALPAGFSVRLNAAGKATLYVDSVPRMDHLQACPGCGIKP
jgi:RNA polymerase sigma factor (sigma-70 family)